MSVNVASIASRGRRVYNQQTVLHVLRLVHSHFTPIPHPVIRQHSPTIGRSTFDAVNAVNPVASLRRYGNARAVQEEEVVSDDHDLPHVDEPPLSESNPGLVGSSSDLRDIPPDLLHFIERDDNINLPYRLDGDVLDPQPAQQLYADLLSGRYKSVADLVSADLDPISLASLPAIRAILLTFEQRGVTEGQWIWLAQRLAALRDCVVASRIDVDVRLPPLVHLITAYCISQSAQHLAPVSADRVPLIRRLLHKAAMSRDSILRKRAAPPPLESTLSAVLLARLSDWDAAKQSVYGAFTAGNLKKRYYRIDLRFLSQYHAILERNERLDDFYDIIMEKADAIVNALTREEPQSDAEQRRQSVVSTALSQTLLGLLGRIERVDRWYADVVQAELRSGAKGEEDVGAGPSDITSRDVAGKLSKSTRALGSLLFMTFSSKPERMGETQGLLRQLFYHDIWPPAHRVADFCEILTAAGRQNHVLEAYNRLTRVQGEWSAQLLRRFIFILLRNDLAVEADELHAELVKLPSATSRDRTMVAFHYAQKGNVDAVEENLQRTFGAEWLKVVESLAMLLEVWLARRTRAKVKRFVTLIAKFARTQTSHLNYLLNHYAQRGQVSEGLAVFNSFLDRRRGNKPDLGTFSALIRLFGRQGDSRNVDKIVQGAVESGIALTGPFCAQIVEAGIRSQNWLTVSRRWSAFPPDIKAHPFVVAAIMKAFVYLAVPYDFVLSFFRSIDKPIHSHWHMIILSACDARKMLDAEKLLLAMERRALHLQSAPLPDKFIYATVMHGYLRLNQLDHAEQTFNRMATRKLVPTGVTFAMMIDAFDRNYSAANTVEQAYRFSVTVFERQHRGIQPGEDGSDRRFARYNLYARLIRMAGARGMRRRVDALYHEATRNMEPTIATQTLVMQAYYRMGHTRSAQRLWTDMYERALRVIGTESSGLSEQVPQSNVLCQALTMILTMSSDDGDHDKVVSIWKKVSNAGFGLDSASYNAYARALAKTGDIDGALHVLEHVLLPRAEASKDAAARTYGAAGGLESLTALEDAEIEDAARTQDNVGSDATSAAPEFGPEVGPVTVEPARVKDAETADSSSSSAAASSITHENDSDSWQSNAAIDASINTDSDPKPTPPPSRYLAPGYRPSATAKTPQITKEADPARPSDKRPDERSILQTTPIAVDSSVAPTSDVLTRDVLENWRPGNASWKPSSGLCSVLCALFGQLQRQAQQSRSKSKRTNRTTPPKPLDPVYLRKGVPIPLRARDGTVWRALPADILAHYRARYPCAVEMIDTLRAERAASPTGGKINSWTRRAVRLNEAIRVAPARKKRELFALRARRSALFQPRSKRPSRSSPWRSLRKWQEVMQTTPEQWAQLKARSAQRRMANVSVYKGNWSLVRPSRPVGTRAPSMADLKAEEDPTKRAEMAQRLEEMVRLSSVLAKKEVVQREQAITPRRKIRPRVYGLEAKREEREIKEREKSNPLTKSKLSRQQRRRQKQRERKAEGEQARSRDRGGLA